MGKKSECIIKSSSNKFGMYNTLINLRTSGTRDYHNLSAAYLTATSIFIGFISFLFNQNSTIFTYIGIIFFSIIGLMICFQMWLAQSRFRFINNYWEEKIKKIENDEGFPYEKYFVELYDTRLKDSKNSRGIKWGDTRIGGRMKVLPWIFGFVLLCFIFASLSILWIQRENFFVEIATFLTKLYNPR